MIHNTFAEKISAWLDNELNPTEISELQTHLAGCPACRHTYQAMQQVDHLLRSAAEMAGPLPGFSQRFEARLAHHQQARWRLWLGLGALLVGTLFVVGFGAVVMAVTMLDVSSIVNADLLYRGLAQFIELVEEASLLFDLVSLLVKACLITMSEPLFWVCALAAAALAGLWIRGLRSFFRQPPAAVELLI
jgi:predicted anti-sigma-YlaC factor YlaD